MCGFYGIFGPNASQISEARYNKIASSLSHRGPDDYQRLNSDSYALMFWRLSIVDRVGGKQPMVSNDKLITLLFNGEIYNYKQIRLLLQKEGKNFKTSSDTEVILKAYEKWGVDCFNHFEGMFAICLIDLKKQTVILARDRLGVKPLYFSLSSDTLRVASEQKAIFSDINNQLELDKTSFFHYLVFQTTPGTQTLVKGVSKVPPGCVFRFGTHVSTPVFMGVTEINSQDTVQNFASFNHYSDQVRKTVLDQSDLVLDTDLPICFHLSGGLDSNTLISICRYFDPERKFIAVSSIVNGITDPESKYIFESAEYYQCPLKTVDINAKSFFNILDDVIYYLDEPVGDPGVVAQFLVNQEAADESKIVFAGQGFDEMFFGYTRNLAAYVYDTYGAKALNKNTSQFESLNQNTKNYFNGWENFLKNMSVQEPLDPTLVFFRKLCRFDPFEKLNGLNERFRSALLDSAMATYLDLKRRSYSFHDFIFLAETEIQLPALLHMEDRASMRYSIETRVPFCTKSIIDISRQSKIDWKFNDGQPKGVLRHAFNDIIPEHIAKRKNKVGRPIPFREWLTSDLGRDHLAELKGKSEIFSDLIGVDLVQYSLKHPNPYDRTAWGLLCFSKWINKFNVSV